MPSTGRTRGLASGLLVLAIAPILASGAASGSARVARPLLVAPSPAPLPNPDSEAALPAAAPAPAALEAPPPPASPAPAAAAAPVQTDKLRLYGMMDREVVGPDKNTVGHVIDVLVNEDGLPQAVLVETGGFMGVGDRRIAISWQDVVVDPRRPGEAVHITMTTDQIRAAPAWEAGAPAFVAVGAAPPPAPIGPPPVAAAPAPLPLTEEGSTPLIAPAPPPLAVPTTRAARGRG